MMPLSMVGRDGQLAELVRIWSRLTSGDAAPRVAVVTGAAGCGKSLLVRSALAALRPRPAVVVSGGARIHSPARTTGWPPR